MFQKRLVTENRHSHFWCPLHKQKKEREKNNTRRLSLRHVHQRLEKYDRMYPPLRPPCPTPFRVSPTPTHHKYRNYDLVYPPPRLPSPPVYIPFLCTPAKTPPPPSTFPCLSPAPPASHLRHVVLADSIPPLYLSASPKRAYVPPAKTSPLPLSPLYTFLCLNVPPVPRCPC